MIILPGRKSKIMIGCQGLDRTKSWCMPCSLGLGMGSELGDFDVVIAACIMIVGSPRHALLNCSLLIMFLFFVLRHLISL